MVIQRSKTIVNHLTILFFSARFSETHLQQLARRPPKPLPPSCRHVLATELLGDFGWAALWGGHRIHWSSLGRYGPGCRRHGIVFWESILLKRMPDGIFWRILVHFPKFQRCSYHLPRHFVHRCRTWAWKTMPANGWSLVPKAQIEVGCHIPYLVRSEIHKLHQNISGINHYGDLTWFNHETWKYDGIPTCNFPIISGDEHLYIPARFGGTEGDCGFDPQLFWYCRVPIFWPIPIHAMEKILTFGVANIFPQFNMGIAKLQNWESNLWTPKMDSNELFNTKTDFVGPPLPHFGPHSHFERLHTEKIENTIFIVLSYGERWEHHLFVIPQKI